MAGDRVDGVAHELARQVREPQEVPHWCHIHALEPVNNEQGLYVLVADQRILLEKVQERRGFDLCE